jgi:hypothetical protein
LGFIDFAWSISLQKDDTKVKIIEDATIDQPTIRPDDVGFCIKIPTPKSSEDGSVKFLGNIFTDDTAGKIKVGRLFRASIFHLSAHTLVPFSSDKASPKVEAFVKSLITDAYVNAILQEKSPDSLKDIAYANTLAYQKIKSPSRIYTTSTRVMATLLKRLWINSSKGETPSDEYKIIDQIANSITKLKATFSDSIRNNRIDSEETFDDNFKQIAGLLDPLGPFLEAPSFRHTESLGPCSIYTDIELPNPSFQEIFSSSLSLLGSPIPSFESLEKLWKPEQDAEALQAFNSDRYQKQREQKILAKIEPYLEITQFKSVSFPEEDYTQYLRARSLVQGASRRLLDILRSAFNYLDEDPRQEMGQLDLTAVIQSLASTVEL